MSDNFNGPKDPNSYYITNIVNWGLQEYSESSISFEFNEDKEWSGPVLFIEDGTGFIQVPLGSVGHLPLKEILTFLDYDEEEVTGQVYAIRDLESFKLLSQSYMWDFGGFVGETRLRLTFKPILEEFVQSNKLTPIGLDRKSTQEEQ